MANAIIGSLRVNLGLDTAAFNDGLKGAQTGLHKFGRRMQSLGKTMSTRVTAPIAGVAAGLASMVTSMAGDINNLMRSAQVSNVDFEQFQKLAFAARSVNIEGDKLADIFKDVNDRIGDFNATGGGPMADFFENIAPKIGITAEAFRNLSGPQALQLYYDSLVKAGASQQDMTFYLEAMASDATALIPLLRDGGKAFRELGAGARIVSADEAAGLKAYNDAMKMLTEAMKGLAMALASSGLIEGMRVLIEHVTSFVTYLSETSPELLKWGTIIAGVAAAIGPALVAFGLFATVIAGISAPIAAVVVGFAALTSALVYFWPQIEATTAALNNLARVGLEAIAGLVRGVTEWIEGKLAAVWDGLASKIQWVGDQFKWLYDSVVGNSWIPDMVEGVESWMGRLGSSFGDSIGGLIKGTLSFREALAGLLKDLAQFALSKINIGGGGFGDLVSGIAGSVFGFARGGTIMPGGAGGIDSQLVQFRKSPNERVDITKPGQSLGGGEARVTIEPSPYFNAVVDGRAAAVARPIARDTAAAGIAANEKMRQRRQATHG